jgi:hypothetical protein
LLPGIRKSERHCWITFRASGARPYTPDLRLRRLADRWDDRSRKRWASNSGGDGSPRCCDDAIVGGIVGNVIAFSIGRVYGIPAVAAVCAYLHLNDSRIKIGQYLFLRHGGKAVLIISITQEGVEKHHGPRLHVIASLPYDRCAVPGADVVG